MELNFCPFYTDAGAWENQCDTPGRFLMRFVDTLYGEPMQGFVIYGLLAEHHIYPSLAGSICIERNKPRFPNPLPPSAFRYQILGTRHELDC